MMDFRPYFIFLFLGVMMIVTSAHAQDSSIRHFQAKELRADFDVLIDNLKTVHPGLYRFTSKEEMEALFGRIRKDLGHSMSAIEFYRKLVELYPAIGNAHTHIFPPEAYIRSLKTTGKRFPFRLHFDRGKIFVLEDASNEQRIGAGRQIAKVNGHEITSLIEFLAEAYPTDGFNRTLPIYVATAGFSRRFALHFGTPDHFDIEYVDVGGALVNQSIEAITTENIQHNQEANGGKFVFPYSNSFNFQIYGGVGYLRLGTFQPPLASYSSSQYRKFLKSSFLQIKKLGLEKLLIDVRGNGGGFPESTYLLLSYLVRESFHPVRNEYAKVKRIREPHHYREEMFFKHFNRQRLKRDGDVFTVRGAKRQLVKPKSTAFTKKLFVLTDARCASACGEAAGLLKYHANAYFLGEEPGGNPVSQAANDLLQLVLPHTGITVQIPAILSEGNVNLPNIKEGVYPDFEISATAMDLLQKSDVVLTKAIEHMQSLHW